MNEPPQLLRPVRHTSGGQSPARQNLPDDILAHLSPQTAFEALAAATGTLRKCLDGASVAEREFAMRTAMASKSIWEWVGELGDWTWPSGGGPAGFESPGGKRRRLSIQITGPEGEDQRYIGSVLAENIAQYAMRIEQISQSLQELDVEEIKTHVLTNHIMPLSRPTTPMSDYSNRSSYIRMEDLTAVITAIVIQTLPDLARLSRLLQVWSLRISVLQLVPSLLQLIGDAEHALDSGWMAITSPPKDSTQNIATTKEVTLARPDFEVMKAVIEKKVTKPGRSLDYMLDLLEGLPDTLPDSWLDRMEAVESSYSEWVAACERKIRETEWAKASRLKVPRSKSPEKGSQDENGQSKRSPSFPEVDIFPIPVTNVETEEPSKERRDAESSSHCSDDADIPIPDTNTYSPKFDSSPTAEPRKIRISTSREFSGLDGAGDGIPSARVQPPTPTRTNGGPSPLKAAMRPKWNTHGDICGADSSDEPMSSPELPPLRIESRRSSETSQTSTVMHTLHRTSSQFLGLSSDLPEVSASPGVSKLRIREAEYRESIDSPPSSPPLPDSDTRESSGESSELTQTATPGIDESATPKTPFESSFNESYFDDSFSVSETASPIVRRGSTGDQQLQRQISQIIEGIPAKIKLSTEPPNLNLPDLHLPKLRTRPSKEPMKRRSVSSLSQRAVTPSFTLCPAKNSRPRNRGQQEIKVYHLSRSTGEAPIKLFIRCVGEHGERVMVRVGGGWADLSEYLKEYASHHGRRSGATDNPKVEVRDVPNVPTRGVGARSSPPGRPASALDSPLTPMTPLAVRKTRRSIGAASGKAIRPRPTTPGLPILPSRTMDEESPMSERGTRSRSNSRLSWVEDDSSFLGLAGPSGKKVEMSEESKAWVESVKQKVRLASGERKISATDDYGKNKFGELGKVGGTKRLFRKGGELPGHKDTKV